MHSILKVASAVFFLALSGGVSAAGVAYQELRLQTAADTDWEFRQLVNNYLRAWSPGCRKFDIGLATQFYEKTGRFSGYHKNLDTRARVLLVWERVNDRWLISREEVTSILSESTAAR